MKQGVLRLGTFLAAEAHGTRAPRVAAAPRWALDTLSGRVCELSAQAAAARLSFAFELVAEAQRRGDTAAWVTDRESTFFPPDAAANGVAVDALPVVFVPDAAAAARAADKLVRSGGFGLVVADLVPARGAGTRASSAPVNGPDRPRRAWPRPPPAQSPARNPSQSPERGYAGAIPPALIARLAGLAQQHEAAVLFLTEKAGDEPSLGPLVSLRCEAVRQPAERGEPGRFLCLTRALKDKRGGPGWTVTEVRRGPVGLR